MDTVRSGADDGGEHGLQLGLGLGELAERLAVGDDAAAGDEARRAPVGGQLGAADGDGPRAVAGGVDPADRAAVATAGEAFGAGDQRQRRRPAGSRRAPVWGTAR